jgi:hypothetical protein
MTGNEGIRTSATNAGTYGDTVYKSPCRINWVDTPGFKLPGEAGKIGGGNHESTDPDDCCLT